MKKVFGVLIFMMAFCGGASATPFGFNCITNKNPNNCSIGEAQLWVDVLAVGTTQVDFVFHNKGPYDSSITDVYFDDGTLFNIAEIINGAGVKFSQWATPQNLPGGNNISPPFVTTEGFSADSNPPVQPNGVNPGEYLTIRFNLKNSMTYADTLAALANGSLRIGIHVQGFTGGGSESFVNNPTPIPEPGSVILIGCGLALLGIIASRKR